MGHQAMLGSYMGTGCTIEEGVRVSDYALLHT